MKEMLIYLACCIAGLIFNATMLVLNIIWDDMGMASASLLGTLTCMYYGGWAAIEVGKQRY